MEMRPEMNIDNLTWERLCELEPRLLALHRRAKAIKDDERKPWFCANDVWYGRGSNEGLKEELRNLVGWRRKGHPILGSSEAYDVAYDTVYDVLPPCRNCGC